MSPLLVVDTIAASIAMDNENDNAEASTVIAQIKDKYRGMPVCSPHIRQKSTIDPTYVISRPGAQARLEEMLMAHSMLFVKITAITCARANVAMKANYVK